MANKAVSEKSKTDEAPANSFAEMQAAGLGNMVGLGTAWFEAMGDMSTEVMDFVTERIKEDVKTQHQILNCKNMSELQQIQAGFLEKAFEQYQAETGKLLEMSTKVFKKLRS